MSLEEVQFTSFTHPTYAVVVRMQLRGFNHFCATGTLDSIIPLAYKCTNRREAAKLMSEGSKVRKLVIYLDKTGEKNVFTLCSKVLEI